MVISIKALQRREDEKYPIHWDWIEPESMDRGCAVNDVQLTIKNRTYILGNKQYLTITDYLPGKKIID